MSESSPGAQFNPKRIERLRSYTWWALVPFSSLYAAVVVFCAIVGFTNDKYEPYEFVILLGLALLLTVEGTRFSLGLMSGLGKSAHRGAEQATIFVISLLAMIYAVWLSPKVSMPWTLFPSILASIAVATSPRRFRWYLMAAMTLLITGVAGGAGLVLANPVTGFMLAYFAFAVTVFTMFALFAQTWSWDIVLELDNARATSAELAVTKERLRFAADLHDIQGHHLQVIALKAEIAERLTGIDDAAAREQSAEIAELARTALKDTRDIVRGYSRSNLTTELANAREILEAAGIQTTVDGEATSVAPPLQPLFGSLVREGATNILRHSDAEHCELRISQDGEVTEVHLRNDGARQDSCVPGSGIEGLRQRFGDLDGRVHIGLRDGWFELTGYAVEPGRTRP